MVDHCCYAEHLLFFIGVFVQPTLRGLPGYRTSARGITGAAVFPPAHHRPLLRSLTHSQLVYVTSCAFVLSCSFRPPSVVPVGACLFCVVRVPQHFVELSLEFVDKDVALRALLKCETNVTKCDLALQGK